MKVGISVICTICNRRKAPRGRSVPAALYGSLCQTWDCPGFDEVPLSGDLWPGETEEEFGYPVSSEGAIEEKR